jgi:hypothetical protein
MHDEIRNFSLEGLMREANIVETKERLIGQLESIMRDYDYVPALDIEPQFTLNYSIEDEGFKFALTCYGIKVEKENTWRTSGVMGGKAIAKYIPPSKSKQLQISVD